MDQQACVTGANGVLSSPNAIDLVNWGEDPLIAIGLTSGGLAVYHGHALLSVLSGRGAQPIAACCWGLHGDLLLAVKERSLLRWRRKLHKPIPSHALCAEMSPVFEPFGDITLPSPAKKLAWGPPGLAAATESGVMVWNDIPALEDKLSPEVPPVCVEATGVRDIAWSGDGHLAVLVQGSKTLEIYKTIDGKVTLTSRLQHPCEVTGLDLHPSAGALLTTAADKVVRVWSEASGNTFHLCQVLGSGRIARWVTPAKRSKDALEGDDTRDALWGLADVHDDQGPEPTDKVVILGEDTQLCTLKGIGAVPRSVVAVTGVAVLSSEGLGGSDLLLPLPHLGLTMLAASAEGVVREVHWSSHDSPMAVTMVFTGHCGDVVAMTMHPHIPLAASVDDQGMLVVWMANPLVGSLTTSMVNSRHQFLFLASYTLTDHDGTFCLVWAPETSPPTLFVSTSSETIPFHLRIDPGTLQRSLSMVAEPSTPSTPLTPEDHPTMKLDDLPSAPCAYSLVPHLPLVPPRPIPLQAPDEPGETEAEKEEPIPETAPEATGKAAMMEKYKHLMKKDTEGDPPPEASGKAAMMEKYKHLLKKDTEGDPPPEASGKAAMMEKYKHLLKDTTEGAASSKTQYSDPSCDAGDEEATAPPLTLECFTVINGTTVLVLVRENGMILVWTWHQKQQPSVLRPGGTPGSTPSHVPSHPPGVLSRSPSHPHLHHPPGPSPTATCSVRAPAGELRGGAAIMGPLGRRHFIAVASTGSSFRAVLVDFTLPHAIEVAVDSTLFESCLVRAVGRTRVLSLSPQGVGNVLQVQVTSSTGKVVIRKACETALLSTWRKVGELASPVSTVSGRSSQSMVHAAGVGDPCVPRQCVVVTIGDAFYVHEAHTLRGVVHFPRTQHGTVQAISTGCRRYLVVAHKKAFTVHTIPAGEMVPAYHPDNLEYWLEATTDTSVAHTLFSQLLKTLSVAAKRDARWNLQRIVDNNLSPQGGDWSSSTCIAGTDFEWDLLPLTEVPPSLPDPSSNVTSTSECAMTSDEAESLAEFLGRAQLPGLGADTTLRVLSLVDILRAKEGHPEALDQPGHRVLHQAHVNRVMQHGSLNVERNCFGWESIAWALHSECTDTLLDKLAVINKGLRWDDAVRLRIGIWLRSFQRLRQLMEKIALQRFQDKREPRDAAFLYIALGKTSLLTSLCRTVHDSRLEAFFDQDFSLPENQQKAVKNALAAAGKGNPLLGAAFFFLASRPNDAAKLLMQKTKDWTMVFTLLRLLDGTPMLGPLATAFVEQQLDEASDPWCRHTMLWLLGRYPESIQCLFGVQDSPSLYEFVVYVVHNSPQLRLAVGTLIPPQRRAALLLQSMEYHMRNGRLPLALLYHRAFAAFRGMDSDDAAERRKQKKAKAQQAAIETGTLDFGAFFAGGSAPEEEEEEEAEEVIEREVPVVLEELEVELAVGLVCMHLENVSIWLSGAITHLIATSEEGSKPEWSTVVDAFKALLDTLTSELNVKSGDLCREGWRYCVRNHHLVGMSLLKSVQLGECLNPVIPRGILHRCAVLCSRVGSLCSPAPTNPTPAMSVRSAGRSIFQILALLWLLRRDPTVRSEVPTMISGMAAGVASMAWQTQNFPLLLALATAPWKAKAEVHASDGVEWFARVLREKSRLEEATLHKWNENRTESLQHDNDTTPMRASDVRALQLVGWLVGHATCFHLRNLLPRTETTSRRGLLHYIACVSTSRRILQRIYTLLEGEEPNKVISIVMVLASSLHPSAATAKAICTGCRDELKADLAGWTLPSNTLPNQLQSWSRSISDLVRHHSALNSAVHIVSPVTASSYLSASSSSKRRSQITGATAANEVLYSILTLRPKTRPVLTGVDDEEREVHRSKKGPIYDFFVHSHQAVVCYPKGGGEFTIADTTRQPHQHHPHHQRSHRRSSSQGRGEHSLSTASSVHPPSLSDCEDDTFSRRMGKRLKATPAAFSHASMSLLSQLRVPLGRITGGVEASDTLDDMRLRSMCAHPTMPLHLAGGMDGSVHLFYLGNPSPLRTYREGVTRAGTAAVLDINFSEEGHCFCAADYRGVVSVWRLEGDPMSLNPILTSTVHKHTSVASFFMEPTLVASVGGGKEGGLLGIHDLVTLSTPLTTQLPSSFEACCACPIRPSHDIFVGGRRGEVLVYDMRRLQTPAYQGKIHERSIRAAAGSPTDKWVAAGTSDGDILLLKPSTGIEVISTFPEAHPRRVGFSFDSGASSVSGVTALHFTATDLVSSGADGRLCRRALLFSDRQE